MEATNGERGGERRACERARAPRRRVLAQKITGGAFWMEIFAMIILGGTWLAWEYFSSEGTSSPFYY